MKNKRALLFCLLIFVFGAMAFIPRQDGGIERLVASLQQWAKANPQEKVHLHLDKPYYALGDTIWFKAYVTVGSRHQLSALSGALYVELIDGQDSLVKDLKLPVVSGTTYGDFMLEDTLLPGSYRIRAYTQWMRNAGEDYFFERKIIVGSFADSSRVIGNGSSGIVNNNADGNKKETSNGKAIPADFDIQFFPESGNLVNGIASRLGFKAIDAHGRSMAVEGIILDESDKEIINFKSLYAGIGSVVLKPQSGKAYRAKVVLPDSTSRIVELPKALDSGYVLSVYQPKKDSVLIRISAPATVNEKTQQTLNLVVQSGGEPVFAAPVTVKRSITSFWLHKLLFPSGIAQFTLFNANNEPLNERIAFIKSPDKMDLKLNTAKKIYKSREKVEVELAADDSNGEAVSGNFSVTVLKEDLVKIEDEHDHTIFSDILLSSDLKGYIETPNYYFGSASNADDALDNLMLTQGYRRFVWKDLVKDEPLAQMPFQVEHLSSVISGKVQSLGNKPSANSTVTLMSVATGIVRDTITDANGRFAFNNLILTDGIKFSVQARTDKKSNKVEVVMDSLAKQGRQKSKYPYGFNSSYTAQMTSYLKHSDMVYADVLEKRKLSEMHELKEVKIKALKAAPVQQVHNLNGPDKYDQLVKGEDLETCPNLRACLEGQLRGVVFKSMSLKSSCPEVSIPFSTRSTGRLIQDAMLIVLDGYPISVTDLDCSTIGGIFDYNDPSRDDIYTIEVLRSPNYTAVYGKKGSNCGGSTRSAASSARVSKRRSGCS